MKEQRYWHAVEIENWEPEREDPHFRKFLARTYDGEFVDFQNPVQEVIDILIQINQKFDNSGLFKRVENKHFRIPVENTEKTFYDCCSEFYKLVGPDSLNQKAIKSVLENSYGLTNLDFVHAESSRALSSIQLLELLETTVNTDGLLSRLIKEIGKNRVNADHRITEPVADEINYVEEFITLCEEYVNAGKSFKRNIRKRRIGDGRCS